MARGWFLHAHSSGKHLGLSHFPTSPITLASERKMFPDGCYVIGEGLIRSREETQWFRATLSSYSDPNSNPCPVPC